MIPAEASLSKLPSRGRTGIQNCQIDSNQDFVRWSEFWRSLRASPRLYNGTNWLRVCDHQTDTSRQPFSKSISTISFANLKLGLADRVSYMQYLQKDPPSHLKPALNKQMRVWRVPRQRARFKSSIEHLALRPQNKLCARAYLLRYIIANVFPIRRR